jgi:hypothetical protein
MALVLELLRFLVRATLREEDQEPRGAKEGASRAPGEGQRRAKKRPENHRQLQDNGTATLSHTTGPRESQNSAKTGKKSKERAHGCL